MLKHYQWKYKALTSVTGLASSCFIHRRTPDEKGVTAYIAVYCPDPAAIAIITELSCLHDYWIAIKYRKQVVSIDSLSVINNTKYVFILYSSCTTVIQQQLYMESWSLGNN